MNYVAIISAHLTSVDFFYTTVVGIRTRKKNNLQFK